MHAYLIMKTSFSNKLSVSHRRTVHSLSHHTGSTLVACFQLLLLSYPRTRIIYVYSSKIVQTYKYIYIYHMHLIYLHTHHIYIICTWFTYTHHICIYIYILAAKSLEYFISEIFCNFCWGVGYFFIGNTVLWPDITLVKLILPLRTKWPTKGKKVTILYFKLLECLEVFLCHCQIFSHIFVSVLERYYAQYRWLFITWFGSVGSGIVPWEPHTEVWKRIGVMVCKKSAYPNCSGALTNYSGRLITATEDL